MPSKNKIDPEMMSLFKIFGISSIVFVFVISFFNEKRPVSVDQDSYLAIDDASRLYFKNVRQAYYDREGRDDAKMNIFRLGKRITDQETPNLNVAILINRIKDEAYLYVEPSEVLEQEEVIAIKWVSENELERGELVFKSGDRYDHYSFVEKLYPLLLANASFQVNIQNEWFPLFQEQRARDAFRITSFDYFRLIGREEMNR